MRGSALRPACSSGVPDPRLLLFLFYQRAKAKGHTEAVRREAVYAICGIAIVASILVMGLDAVTGDHIREKVPQLTFYVETAALIAFGISWLTASRTLPLLTRQDERFSILTGGAPPD